MLRRSFALLAAALLLAMVAAGCGDDDPGSNGSGTAASESSGGPGSAPAPEGQGVAGDPGSSGGISPGTGSGSGDGGDTGGSGAAAPQGGSSSGGDNSLQTYGEEAQGEERNAVATAMQSYFTALSDNDYLRACSYFTSTYKETLEKGLAQLLESDGGSGCPALAKLLPKLSGSLAEESRPIANGTIKQVRVEGGNAFVLYLPEKGKLSYFPMQEENGAWKTSTLVGTEIP